MVGSRQHLPCSFMRACLRCLTLVDPNVLLHVPTAVGIMVLLYCGGCGVATTTCDVEYIKQAIEKNG